MKKLNLLLYLAIVLLFTTNCTNDQNELFEEAESAFEFKTYRLTSAEIPEITNELLDDMTEKSKLLYAKNKDLGLWADMENVVAVEDINGNLTYSFRIYVEGSDEKALYNLVVNKKVNGKSSAPFVMKYYFDSQNVVDYSNSYERKFSGKN